MHALREWLGPLGPGNGFLEGAEVDTWSEDAEDDFACFSGHGDDIDIFSRLLEGPLLQWWDGVFGNRKHNSISSAEAPFLRNLLGPLRYYSDSHISRIVYTTNTIVASLLPTVPIFLLYYIQSQVSRMGAIVLVNLIFSATLAFLTNAKRSEVFTAATAFAAVQVVFLNNSNCDCS